MFASPIAVPTLEEEAEKAEISWSTLKRAKNKLEIISKKLGGEKAPWCWVRKGKGDQKSIYKDLGPLTPSKGTETPAVIESPKGDQESTQEGESRGVVPFGNDDDIEWIET